MSPSARSHKMTLCSAPATPQIPTATPPATPPQVNFQTDSPLLSLSAELRNATYAYTFTPNIQPPVDGTPIPISLHTLSADMPSSTLLLTCRYIQQEATGLYRAVNQALWQSDPMFSVDLSDDWEDERLRKGRHFEVLDLLDERFLVPELADEQSTQYKTW